MRKEDTPVNGLLEKLLTLPELRELAAEVHKTRCCAAVTGLSPVHRAMVAAALAEETKRPLLLLCDRLTANISHIAVYKRLFKQFFSRRIKSFANRYWT